MPIKRYAIDVDDAVRRYLGGESSGAIARGYGCHSALVLYYLRKAGVQPRTMSEGQRLRVLREGTEHWSRMGQAGRGKPKAAAMLERRAISTEETRWAE